MSTLVIVVLLTKFVIVFSANTIECDDAAHCQCPQNDTCIASCGGGSDCRCSTIECPLNYPCHIDCGGGGSCQYSNFICSTNGELCDIDCGGGDACRSSHISCPLMTGTNDSCINTTLNAPQTSETITISSTNKLIQCTPSPTPDRIYCDDAETCICDNVAECEINCGGINGCQCSNFVCPADYPCYINCGGINSCRETNFQCSSNNEYCQISCGGINSCENANINCPLDSNNECINTTLWAQSTSITISDHNINNCTLSPTAAPVLPPEYINCYDGVCECGNERDCIFECGSGGACHCTTINCPTDHNCYVNCGGGFTCNFTSINCPTNSDKSCFVGCGGGYSCEHVYINSNNMTNNVVITSCDDGHSNCEIGAIQQNPYLYYDECVSVSPTMSPSMVPTILTVSPTVTMIVTNASEGHDNTNDNQSEKESHSDTLKIVLATVGACFLVICAVSVVVIIIYKKKKANMSNMIAVNRGNYGYYVELENN